MTIRISEAYRLLLQVVDRTPVPCLDIPDIECECREADAELARDEVRFDEHIAQLRTALLVENPNEFDLAARDALNNLCSSAMNISTVVSNLAEEIEKVVIARRDLRELKRS